MKRLLNRAKPWISAIIWGMFIPVTHSIQGLPWEYPFLNVTITFTFYLFVMGYAWGYFIWRKL